MRETDVEVGEELDSAGSNEVSAGFVARKGGFVDEQATRAPARASTTAATLPAGPAPTISTSNRRVLIGVALSEAGLVFEWSRRRKTYAASHADRSQPVRP